LSILDAIVLIAEAIADVPTHFGFNLQLSINTSFMKLKKKQQDYEKKPKKKSNLTVFPDPVTVQAIKSLLAKITEIAPFWTGVGFMKPAFFMFDNSKEHNPVSSKDIMYCGRFLPVTYRKINNDNFLKN
jgi:hypothetical protein